MRAQWHALHVHLTQTINRHSFQTDYARLRDGHAPLRRHGDPAGLLDHLHGDGDPEQKNTVLRALVVAAQGGEESAVVLLIVALWPGLDAAYRRLLRHFREPELLVSEISERITRGIRRLDLDRVNRIAATLIRNTERDIMRGLQASWAKDSPCVALLDTDGKVQPEESPLGLAPDCSLDAIIDSLRPLVGRDADLVVAVAVAGEPQGEAAAAEGLRYEAGRKRYRRAVDRLREKLAD